MVKKLVFIFCLFCSSGIYSEEITLSTLQWPPFTDKKAPGMGTFTDLVIKAYQNQGVNPKIEFLPWARALSGAEEGDYGGVFPAYYSKEREEKFYFSDKVDSIKIGLITLKSKNFIYNFNGTNLNKFYDELAEKKVKIGIIKSYVNEAIFDKRKDLNKIEYGADAQAMRALIKSGIDMYFADEIVFKELIKGEFRDYKDDLQFLEPALGKNDMYVVFSKKLKSSAALKDKFNVGLKAVQKH